MLDEPETPEASADPSTCVPCRHLRSKGMLVYNGDAYANPHDEYDNTVFWCVKTMKSFGPDDEMVSRDDCSLADRRCYEPF